MSRLDPKTLEKLIKDSGVSYKQNATSYKFTCPRCNKPEKLWMIKQTGQFICFYCAEVDNFKGRPEYALRELINKPLDDIKQELYGIGPLDVKRGLSLDLRDPNGEEDDFVEVEASPLPTMFPPDARPIKEGSEAGEYLIGRGMTYGLIEHYELMYQPSTHRVLFPVENIRNEIVGWQARTIRDEKPKILTSTGLDKAKALMFHSNLVDSDHAIICEGPLDAIKAHLCGGAVATMGKAVSTQQIRLIANASVTRVYLALDPDAADETRRLIPIFKGLGKEVYLLNTPPGRKDLGEATFEEVLEQFNKAEPVEGARLVAYFKRPD